MDLSKSQILTFTSQNCSHESYSDSEAELLPVNKEIKTFSQVPVRSVEMWQVSE